MEIEIGRQELCKHSKTEAIFKLLSKKGKIKPNFDLVKGYTYPELDEILGETPKDSDRFLERLVASGILAEEFYDLEFRCPDCKSPDVATKYLCPYCESAEIMRNLLVEHVTCGHIDTQYFFREENKCPGCDKKYSEGGFRVAGKWFECAVCKKQIKSPLVTHYCRSCDTLFSLDEAVQRKVFSYCLTDMAKDELKAGILFPSDINNLLMKAGYKAEPSNLIKGKSGIEQKFDFVFAKQNRTLAIDILSPEEPVKEIEIIKEHSKQCDSGIEVCIVAMPKLDEKASALARAYELKVAEAAKKMDALEGLRKLLD